MTGEHKHGECKSCEARGRAIEGKDRVINEMGEKYAMLQGLYRKALAAIHTHTPPPTTEAAPDRLSPCTSCGHASTDHAVDDEERR